MIHLLRSLFVGYFIAVTLGTLALTFGASSWGVFFGVWLGGSFLSVLIAAVMPVLWDGVEPAFVHVDTANAFATEGPMQASLTARELAMWDWDLAAERFEADLAEDNAATGIDLSEVDRKTG